MPQPEPCYIHRQGEAVRAMTRGLREGDSVADATTFGGVRQRGRIIGILVATLALVAGLIAIPQQSSIAANGSDFDPGFIIADDLFYDGAAMSAGQVQSFLNARVPQCRAGYVCLKAYSQDTASRAGEAGRCGGYAGAPGESAATIIAKVGAACGVSQKVLLVLLEKEQSLVTDDWPTSRQYRSATGYGCPDTADCDAAYYGFFNQVWMAALQFKRYQANPGGWRHIAGRTVNVLFHPNAACGSGPVYIMNAATAGLYNYTPYQPNAAALANLYGTGDGCSSYGNRNFWRIYTDWFGPTKIGPQYFIEKTYRDYGAEAGVLGPAVTDIRSFTANGGGAVRGYQNGAIAWSAPRGAFAIMVAIRATYGAWGGVEGWIGWPASGANSISAHGGGTVQAFQFAAIASSQTGTWPIPNANRTALAAVGGIDGEFGWPMGENVCDAQSRCIQAFQGGSVYGRTGAAFGLPASIRAVFETNGGRTGAFGEPTSNPNRIEANGGGRAQGFEKGAIVESPAGTFAVTGGIRTAFNAAGGIGGVPGWPVAAAACDAGGACSQRFQHGSAFSSSDGAAWFIDERLAGEYAALRATLGKPTSGTNAIAANGGGIVQGYEGGAIAWSSTGGAHAITGVLRTQYNALGGIAGQPGWPTGSATCAAGVCTQRFAGGLMVSSAQRGSLVISQATDRYLAAGGPTGSLGWPTTGGIRFEASGGGFVQAFEQGAIAASASGAYVVSGGVRAFYNERGGITGPLGWPASEMTCDSAGTCSQQFQNGRIVWSPIGGGRVE
ncbi:LGFP repeat-containing protein [Agromyces larvae]|uniref:LGFP repeat-containing protein n=1 Tax=Agromyces larvae TaxID=2929802 RepID=A0ABY4C220_9MICO|nr:hypothetical protein [Agromyces larvae]UOE44492.1 hypothetical protein MTO99_01480 [Agromyces larvae]